MTAAVIQAGSSLFDTPGSLAKAHDLISKAASQGAEIIVLPEAFLGGYPKGLDFGVTVGSRTAAGRETFRRYWASAIDVPGPETTVLAGFDFDVTGHYARPDVFTLHVDETPRRMVG